MIPRLLIWGICICLLCFPIISDALPDNTRPVVAPTPLALSPSMTKEVFSYGEITPVILEIRNNGDVPANISGIPPEVVVNLKKTGWNRSTVRTIPAGRENRVIGPGSSCTMMVPWDQKDDRGVQVEPGVYYLAMNASGMNAYDEIVILPPEGVLVGSILPRDTVTSNGIMVQLESVILRENEGLITVRLTNSKESSPQLQAPGLSQVTAQYRIDNRPAAGFRDIFEKDRETGGYEITWKTAPVPCSAKDLNLLVTKFDPYEGVWNFSVNLGVVSKCMSANGTTSQNRGGGKLLAEEIRQPTNKTASGFTGSLCLAAFAGTVLLIRYRKERR